MTTENVFNKMNLKKVAEKAGVSIATVLRGIEDIAYKNRYALIVCNFSQDENKEKLYLDILQSESIDGLIAAPTHEHDQKVIHLVKSGLPIVCVDRGLSGVDVDVVLVENKKG